MTEPSGAKPHDLVNKIVDAVDEVLRRDMRMAAEAARRVREVGGLSSADLAYMRGVEDVFMWMAGEGESSDLQRRILDEYAEARSAHRGRFNRPIQRPQGNTL